MGYVFGPVTTSDEQSASAAIITIPAMFHSLEILPPATGTSTLKVYDSENSTLSGKKVVAEAIIAAGTNSITMSLPSPRVCNRGIRAELSGTATTYIIGFSPL